MQLIRHDSNPHPDPDECPNELRQTDLRFENIEDHDSEEAKVQVLFPNFGRGEKKRSNFAVEITWVDMRFLIRPFVEMNHPEARHLERVIKLSEAIEKAGWPPSSPPSEDFWRILPE